MTKTPVRPVSLLLGAALTAALGGCGSLSWNALKLAPVEERPSPAATAPAPPPVPPPADTPIRTSDAVVYPRPGEFGAGRAPQQLAPPAADAGTLPAPGQSAAPAAPDGSPLAAPSPAPAPAAGTAASRPPLASAAPAPAAVAPAPGAAVPEPPTNPAARALVEQGRVFQQSGELEKAAASYERALEIAPEDAWLWHRLAAVRAAQGQRGLARALARRSNALGAGDTAVQRANAPLM